MQSTVATECHCLTLCKLYTVKSTTKQIPTESTHSSCLLSSRQSKGCWMTDSKSSLSSVMKFWLICDQRFLSLSDLKNRFLLSYDYIIDWLIAGLLYTTKFTCFRRAFFLALTLVSLALSTRLGLLSLNSLRRLSYYRWTDPGDMENTSHVGSKTAYAWAKQNISHCMSKDGTLTEIWWLTRTRMGWHSRIQNCRLEDGKPWQNTALPYTCMPWAQNWDGTPCQNTTQYSSRTHACHGVNRHTKNCISKRWDTVTEYHSKQIQYTCMPWSQQTHKELPI